MIKTAYIRKLPDQQKWRVYSEEGHNMGTYDSKAAAKERLGQVEYFKHQSDDGKVSKKYTMLKDLFKIADYLEDSGFVEEAEDIYNTMGLIDGTLDEQSANDAFAYPTLQNNVGNGGYMGGDGAGGSYSLLSMDTNQVADDQNNVDALVHSNGILGNTVTDNGSAGQFNILNDSQFYNNYDGQ